MSAVTTPVSMSGVWWERGHVHPELSTYPDQFWPRESVLGFGWMRDTQYLNVPYPPEPIASETSG